MLWLMTFLLRALNLEGTWWGHVHYVTLLLLQMWLCLPSSTSKLPVSTFHQLLYPPPFGFCRPPLCWPCSPKGQQWCQFPDPPAHPWSSSAILNSTAVSPPSLLLSFQLFGHSSGYSWFSFLYLDFWNMSRFWLDSFLAYLSHVDGFTDSLLSGNFKKDISS